MSKPKDVIPGFTPSTACGASTPVRELNPSPLPQLCPMVLPTPYFCCWSLLLDGETRIVPHWWPFWFSQTIYLGSLVPHQLSKLVSLHIPGWCQHGGTISNLHCFHCTWWPLLTLALGSCLSFSNFITICFHHSFLLIFSNQAYCLTHIRLFFDWD